MPWKTAHGRSVNTRNPIYPSGEYHHEHSDRSGDFAGLPGADIGHEQRSDLSCISRGIGEPEIKAEFPFCDDADFVKACGIRVQEQVAFFGDQDRRNLQSGSFS